MHSEPLITQTQLAELANHVSAWQLSLAKTHVSLLQFPLKSKAFGDFGGFKMCWVRPSLSPLFCTKKKNLFELNFYVLDLIYSHSRQARLACSLSSLSCSFHCDKNQRLGFKCKCSHSGKGFVVKADTEQCTEGHGSSSRGNAHSTSKWCLFVSNPHRPRELIFCDEWVYFLVRQHLHVLTFSLWWDDEEED